MRNRSLLTQSNPKNRTDFQVFQDLLPKITMFNFFGKKDGYKSIPDSQEVPSGNRYNDDVHVSSMNLRSQQGGGFGDKRGVENIRYRGDKRLIERGGDFHQSTGKIGLRKKIKQRYFRALYGMDLFHSLIDAPTTRILTILLGGYMLIILLFASIYYVIGIKMDCHMNISHFLDAFAFSLETMATIGYSTEDIFFNQCPLPLIVISAQICVKLIADAVTIGVLYCKLSRPHSRASTVIFSEKAIIRRVRGKLYFMFQLCELRKHQLVEAHVRVYVVRNEVDLSHCINDPHCTDEHPPPDNTANSIGNTSNGNTSNGSTTTHHRHPLLASKAKHASSTYAFGSSMSSDEGSMEGLAAVGAYSKMKYHTLPSFTYNNHHPHNHAGGSAGIADDNGSSNGHASFHIHSAASVDGRTVAGRSRTHRPTYMQTSSMRLNHPNDELGSMLLLMTPQVVVHEIDAGSPLMPPPVWYCNFPCDVSTGAVHSYTSALSSWLGSQQVGDQIRWRPPAYKDFIQHVPAPMSMASFEKEQNTPTFASPMASNVVPERRELSAPAAGSKKDGAAERRALHRYNGALEASSTSTSSSTAAPHSSGTKRRSSAQLVAPPPTAHQHHHHSPVPQQAFSEGHASAPQASTWFYDAEALARIEFPSVSRRIDTDNITSAVAQPHPAYHAVHQGAFDGSDGGAGGAGGEPSTPQRPHASGPGDGGGASAGNSQSEVGVRPAMGMSFRNSLGGGGAFFGSSNNLVGDGSPKRDPQEGQDWYFHSAGLNSYADLLNSTRSPLTRDSFYNSSSTSGPHGSEINHHNHHDSNMLDIDIPVTIDEDDDYDDDEGSSPQQSSKTASEKSIIPMRRGSTGSMSLSGGSSPVKVGDKPVAATPTSRIPVFNRGASSYSLLAQPPFPAQVTTPAAAAAGTTAASSVVAGTSSVTSSAEFPSTTTAAPTTPISPTNPNPTTPGESPTERKKSAVLQNPARLSPAAAAVAADIDDDESVRSSISTQGVRTLGRARSKRDMYVSPYKQKRSPSMANVLASPTSPLTPTDAGASFSSTQAVVEMAPAQTEPVSLPALPIPTPAVPPAPAAAAMAATTRPPVSLIPKMSERSNLTPPRAPASTSAAPAVTPAPSALPTQQRPPSGLGQSQPLAYTTNPLHSSGGSQGGGGASAGVQNVSFAAAATSYGSAGVSNTSNGGSSSNSSMGLGGIREAGDWCSYQTWQSEERSMVQRYMRDRQIEIIVIVEGVDAATGGMVQARHSYTSDEVEWNKSFECCVFKDPADGCTTIDFSQFHELVDVPDDAPFAGVVHSSI